jgi:CheY-like chemotaxis protein
MSVPTARVPERTHEARAQAARWRVLLAEDNVANQRVATGLLQKLGCRVDVSANGREAVELWRHLPYDLILMDCNMPEMDGYQATAEIRRQEFSNQHIPIVAITANAMQGDRERCLEAGMDDYISKPIDPQKLQTVLQRLLLTEQDSSLLQQPSQWPINDCLFLRSPFFHPWVSPFALPERLEKERCRRVWFPLLSCRKTPQLQSC